VNVLDPGIDSVPMFPCPFAFRLPLLEDEVWVGPIIDGGFADRSREFGAATRARARFMRRVGVDGISSGRRIPEGSLMLFSMNTSDTVWGFAPAVRIENAKLRALSFVSAFGC
jgi:hypothetical protein